MDSGLRKRTHGVFYDFSGRKVILSEEIHSFGLLVLSVEADQKWKEDL
jgi:hypothetical protein